MMLRGARELHARLRALQDVAQPIRRAWATETATLARNRVRVASGKTRVSIQRVGDKVEAGGGARFLEKGAVPHPIEPVQMTALKWNAAGLPRFAKRVRHPGSRKQPFMRPAGEDALDKIGPEIIVDTWNRAA